METKIPPGPSTGPPIQSLSPQQTSNERSPPQIMKKDTIQPPKPEHPDEDISFDPEGKSAISGQKRTGWI